MSDSINGFIVALDDDITLEAAERLKEAIMLYNGVAGVTPHVRDIGDAIAVMRATTEFRMKLLDFWRTL